MDNVNLGVIGCGKMATDLARRCTRTGRARVSVVADPDPHALRAAALGFNCDAEADVGALCARRDVDAVIVGSPPGSHLANVTAAARGGKAVYCEKPLGISVAECDEMIDACRAAGVPLFVGQVLRLLPLFWHSHVLIRDGAIGEPRAVAVTRAGFSGAFHGGWRAERAQAGGLLLEVNAHELDYMRFLLGEPREVYARLDNILGKMDYEDQGFVTVAFAGGGVGCLHTSMSSPVGEYRVHIQGTAGNMVHGGFGGTLRWQKVGGEAHQVAVGDISVRDPYDREMEAWIDSLTTGAEPLFTGADGRAAVAMAEAAYRSAASGRPEAVAAA
ncbi:MAG: Gfo/Idh/MocA family oxidoreductase [Chthonomonadales bacterium]|nr:Gfo/Idh/MocA family oxidoreductase [Chthonomonadales bacterium]